MASIIKCVNWLGMSVLAECVETKQQNEFAQASGCDVVQGFFFSKPLPSEQFCDRFLYKTKEKEQKKTSIKKETPVHNLTILVIDDSEMERELLEKYLQDDFHIHLSENAEMGLAYLNQHKKRVDMILIDYMMPGMNGLEFLQFCQLDEDLKSIPKIMITSNERTKDQVCAFEAGAYDYLTKPLVPELVRIRIHHAMELNHQLKTSEHEKQEYQHQAELDKATGIFNKITFQTYVKQYLGRETGKQSALLIIDIDDFKGVNDRHGHLMGDRVIKMIASKLSSCFRSTDYVGRFGGDEFTVFMMNVLDEKFVEKKAEDILNLVTKESKEQLGILVTVSIGIGFGRNTDRFEELFTRTDQALYKAKNTGKGKYITV